MKKLLAILVVFCISLSMLIPMSVQAQKIGFTKRVKNLVIIGSEDFNKKLLFEYLEDNNHPTDNIVSVTNIADGTPNSIDSIIYIKEYTRYKKSYRYNDNGKILSILQQYWNINNESWINLMRQTINYDERDNVRTYLIEEWDSDSESWENYWHVTRTYDENYNLLMHLSEEWDRDSLQWINFYRYTYTYDENGNRATYLSEEWYTGLDEWVKTWQNIYSYDENDNLVTSISEAWDRDSLRWENRSRRTITYNLNGNKITQLTELWNNPEGWEDYKRESYSYDLSGNRLTELMEYWDSYLVKWKNVKQDSYSYDENNNLLVHLSEHWDRDSTNWVKYQREVYTYYESRLLTHIINEKWIGSEWVSSLSYLRFVYNHNLYSTGCEELSVYYSTYTSIDNSNSYVLMHYSLSQNFPNPFNPVTTIYYSILRQSNVKIIVYNSLGQEVSVLIDKEHSPGTYKVKFDGSSLSSGIYFYKLISGDYIKIRKSLLIK